MNGGGGCRHKGKLYEYCVTGQCHCHCQPGNASAPNMCSFEKELTTSDVGNLSRLVIPKTYAAKFFPNVSESNDNEGMELEFMDTKTMRRWSFRYDYGKSSRSFMLTKGWNKFVEDKGLKAKDVVIFYKCQMTPDAPNFYVIDVRHCRPQLEGAGAGPSGVAGEEGRAIKLFGVEIQ